MGGARHDGANGEFSGLFLLAAVSRFEQAASLSCFIPVPAGPVGAKKSQLPVDALETMGLGEIIGGLVSGVDTAMEISSPPSSPWDSLACGTHARGWDGCPRASFRKT
jgi:hypothetical protein